MARELQYQGLAELPVIIEDSSRYSAEYFQITKFPELLTAGKNLFRFKGSDKFIEESDVFIEVLDSNGQPIYYEADLDLESTEQSVIVSIYVDEETPPGTGEVILCGYVATTGSISVTEDDVQPNIRWRQPIDIDPIKQNVTEIIFGTIPNVSVNTSSVVDNYTITNYQGNALLKSASIYNFTYDYRNGDNPVIYGTVNTSQLSGIDINGAGVFEVSRSKFTGKPNPDTGLVLTSQVLSGSVIDYISTGSTTIFTINFPFESSIQGSTQIHTFINGTGTTGSLYFEQTASTASSENTYTIISASFSGLSPQVGNITKIRTFYKSVGVGEYVLASETDITDQASEFGYTPESASIIVPLPTVHRNDKFDLKFQFLNFADAVSKQVLYVKDIGMPGGNVYIGGDDNLITGSVYIAGQTGTGVSIEGSTAGAFIRSVGYEGFQNVVANGATGQPGFIMYSGSVVTMLNSNRAENYQGIGLELTAHSESYLRYTTSGSGLLDIRTNKFFLGSSRQYIVGADGLIQISSSNFFLSSSGDVIMAGTITATAGNIGGFTITSHSLSGNNFFISGAATSTGFFISASKFNVKGNGDVTGSNVLFTGGKIAGFTISNDTLSNGSNFYISGSATSNDFFISSSKFNVKANGDVTASSALFSGSVSITGNVNARTGNIGGFNITSDAITGSGFYLSGSATGDGFFISSSAFNVKANGNITGSSVLFTGGKIGSFTLSNDAFTAGSTFFISSSVSGTPGTAFFISSSKFNVKQDGTITGSSALFSGSVSVVGTVNAIAGNIGGFAITSDAITGSGFYLSGSATNTGFFISSSKFNIKGNGDITGSNVLFTGGKVAGWTIIGDKLSGSNATLDAAGAALYMSTKGPGSDTTAPFDILADEYYIDFTPAEGQTRSSKYYVKFGPNFSVSSSGTLFASGAVFQGTVTASAGLIGGWNIEPTYLRSSDDKLRLAGGGLSGYYISSSRFKVTSDGDITGSQVLFTGGKIGGLNLASNKIYIGTGTYGNANTAFYVDDSGQLSLKDSFQWNGTDLLISGSTTRILTPTFYLGGVNQFISGANGNIEISSSNFHLDRNGNVRMSGTITATAGTIGGFAITSTAISSSNNSLILRGDSGIITGSNVLFTGGKIGSFTLSNNALSGINSSTNTTTFFISSSVDTTSPDGVAFFISSSRFNVRQDGTISGSRVLFDGGKVGGFSIDSTKITGTNIIINSAGSLQTADYASNQTGWKISAVDNGFAEFENVRVRGTLKTAVFEKETVNAVGGQLYVANSSTITGSEALTSIPQLVYLKFGGYSGSNAIQNIAGSGNTYVRIASLVTASIANLPTSTQTFKPIGGTGLLIASGSHTVGTTAAVPAQLSGITTAESASLTVMAWVRPNFSSYTSGTPTGSILEKSGSITPSSLRGSFYIGFVVQSSTTASLRISSGDETNFGVFDYAANGPLRNDTWTHIALTLAPNPNVPANYLRTLYVNGVSSTSSNTSYFSKVNTSPINIGVGRSYSERFPGYIADVRVYTGSLSAAEIQAIYSGSYFTGSIEAGTPAIQIDNVTGFINGEILSAKKVDNSGFATEYFQVRDTMRLNPSSDTDFSGILYVTRSYGNAVSGDSGSLGDMPNEAQSYSPSQVIVSTGKIGTGFIRINANPNDQTTPYIDIVERTGSGIYDVKLKARLGDLSGLADSSYVFGNSNPGFGLATDNVFLQGGIIANTGSIGGISMQSSKLFTGTGTFNNNNTGFYLGSDSYFSLGNKLSWDTSTLSINGRITANEGKIGGFEITANAITGSGFYLSGSATNDGTSFFLSSSRFNIKGNGDVTGSQVLFTGGKVGGFDITSTQINDTGNNLILKSSGQITGSNVLFTGGTIGGFTLSSTQIADAGGSTLLLKSNGQITGSNVLFTGGKIGSFTLSNDAFTAGSTFFISSSVSGTPSTAFFISSSKFNVKQDGTITGSNVLFNGGTIGGFTLTSTQISSSTLVMGNLTGISNTGFGPDGTITGNGLYTTNGYFSGKIEVGSIPQAPAAEKLLAYYPLDTLNFIDASGNCPGTSSYAIAPTIVSGSGTIAGYATRGNGASNIRPVTSSAIKDALTSAQFTMCFWYTPTTQTSDYQDLAAFAVTSSTAYGNRTSDALFRIEHQNDSTRVHPSLNFIWGAYGPGLTELYPGLSSNAGYFITGSNYHVTFVSDFAGNSTQLYINGVLNKSGNFTYSGTPVTGFIAAPDLKLRFFRENTNGEILSEFRIYTGSLTAAEIESIYLGNAQLGGGKTVIDGDSIKSGRLMSNNWTVGGTVGSMFDLNAGTFELGGDVNPSFLWDGTNLRVSGSSAQILTPNFFLGGANQYISGSSGNIRISSSNFHLDTAGNVTMAGTVTATAGNIGGFNISNNSLSSTNFFISGSATNDQFFISASNFNVKANGNVTGSSVLFTGGKIGSFTLTNDALTAGSTFFISSSVGATPASAFFISSSRFNVKQDGTITGSQVLFTGGKIAGWTVDSDKLSSGNVTLNATNQQILLGDTTYDAAEIAFTGSGIGKFGSININGVAGALNGGTAFLDTFNGTELDSTLWFNNSSDAGEKARIVSGALRLENGNEAWDYAIVGKKAFQRASSSVFEFHTRVFTGSDTGTEPPRMMIGVTANTSSTHYSDNAHAFYFTRTNITIYNGSTSLSTIHNSVAPGDTYKLILKPNTTSGTQYEIYRNEDYTTVFKTGSIGTNNSASLYPAIWTLPTTSTMEFYSVAAYDSTTPGAFDLKGGGSFGLIDNSGSHLTFTRGGFSLSSPNVDITGRSIRIGDAFKFDGSNLTVSGSSARILTPSFFLGGTNQYISGSGGLIRISSSNFHLDTAGNVTMAGTVTATAGAIGGFNISSNALSSTNFFISGAATSDQFFISASNFNVKANGNVTGSSVLFTGGTIGGINIQSNKLFTGTGTFNNSNTGFYVDNTGQLSLKDKLSWDGTTLSITGDITVTNTEDFASLRDKSTYVTALIATASGYVSFNSHTNAIFTRHGYTSALTTTVTGSNTLSDISASYDLYVIDYANGNAANKAQLILDLFDAGYSVFSTGNDTSTSNTTGSAGSEWPIIAAVSKGTNGNFTSSSLATGIGGISPNDPISFGWTSFYTASESDNGNLPTKLKTNMNGASTCVPLAISGSTQADAVPESNTAAAYVAFYATNPRGGRWVHTNARILSAGLNPSASIKLLDLLYRRDSAQEAYHDGFTKITGNMIQTGKIQSTNWTTGGSVGSEFNLNNGTFKLGGDVNPEFSWDGTNLRVSGSSTELLTPSFLLGGANQYISGSGGTIRISSSNFHLDTAGNVTMAGTVTATAGTIGGFTIGASALTATNFAVNSTAGEIELGSATAYGTGNGVYISKATTDNFRVGNVGGARMQFSGTNLEIYNSSNAKVVSIGASNTIGGFTLTDTQINDTAGTNLILKSSGQITGSNVLFTGGKIGGFNITSTQIADVGGATLLLKDSGQITGSSVSFTGGTVGGFTLSSTQINDTGNNLVLKSSGQITGSNVLFNGGKVGGFNITSTQIADASSNLVLKDSGQITGSNVLFTGGKVGGFTLSADKLSGTNFNVSSSGVLTLGSATSFTAGDGIYLSNASTNNFRVGDAGGARMQFDGTNLEIYSASPSTKLLSIGATNTIAGFTLSNSTLSNGSNFFISGSATGTGFFISASQFNVKANGEMTASNALFTGIATADIILDKTVSITAANSASYLTTYDYNPTATVNTGYWLKLDASLSATAEEVRRVYIDCKLVYPLGKITFPSISTTKKIDIILESAYGNQLLDIFGGAKSGIPAVVDFPAGSTVTLTAIGTAATAEDWNCVGGSFQPFSGYTFKRGLITSGSVESVSQIRATGSISLPAFASVNDSQTGMYFPETDTIGFVENGTETMRIDSSGRVMIGTTTPLAKLHVQGDSAYASPPEYAFYSLNASTNAAVSGYNAGGSSINYSIYASGRIFAGEINTTSDSRLKNIHETVTVSESINLVKSLDAVKYNWITGSDQSLKTGYIAQQAIKSGFEHLTGIIPNDIVSKKVDDDGFVHPDKFQFTMNYEQVIPYHGVVIKHLLEKIDQLEQKIDELSRK